MQKNKKLILIILDGWGIAESAKGNAITNSKTPFISSLYQKKVPNAQLTTHGTAVGLPPDQMGNSEVGHLNIGAGRIVYQELMRINNTIKDKSFFELPTLLYTCQYACQRQVPVHLIGLVSDGGVHSHIQHLFALCTLLHAQKVPAVFIHIFTDGRDTSPTSAITYITDLQNFIKNMPSIKIASVCGRYYAMDRDKRWERTLKAYNLLVKNEGEYTTNVLESIQKSYDAGITDEFLNPLLLQKNSNLKPNDAVICFNFRTDRCRQITEILTQSIENKFNITPIPLHYVTFTRYDHQYKNVEVVFEKDDLKNTLGEVLAKHHKTQIRIAETEKYPHVTFFFSGGRENTFEGEKRLLVQSPKVATYDLQPQMSAPQLTAAILPELQHHTADFICLNFANPDMVGHTGNLAAAITAVETVDTCTAQIAQVALQNNYFVLIIADHGNAEYMQNPDGSPNTAHTTNPVPIFLILPQPATLLLKNGKLADIAPTILHLLQLPIPPEMTGEILVY